MKTNLKNLAVILILNIIFVACQNKDNDNMLQEQNSQKKSLAGKMNDFITTHHSDFGQVLILNDYDEAYDYVAQMNALPLGEVASFAHSHGWTNETIRSFEVYTSVIGKYAKQNGVSLANLEDEDPLAVEKMYEAAKVELLSKYRNLVFYGILDSDERQDTILSPIGEINFDILFNEKNMLVIGNEIIKRYPEGYASLTMEEFADLKDNLSLTNAENHGCAVRRIATNPARQTASAQTLVASYEFVQTAYAEEHYYKMVVGIETDTYYSRFYHRQDLSTNSYVKNYKQSAGTYWLTEFPTSVDIQYRTRYVRINNGGTISFSYTPIYPASFNKYNLSFTHNYANLASEMIFETYGISQYKIDVHTNRVGIDVEMQ